ncbi:transcription antitermination factor NusB [Oceanithermus sp.]|uniref:transcription antitermination factor NusB n=1 Tax=Oceanithermus sp. TaxID=2268145 RepID=UPI0025FC7F91|nr:transcription antitermination factor NusB [Oceanithermus sp.]
MRRKARELAFRVLFEHAQGDVPLEEAWNHALAAMDETDDEPLDAEGRAFARRLVWGYADRADEVDRILAETVEGWDFNQMSKTDLTVLRLATYEMLYEATPFAPLIEVAVRIAGKYGGEDSGKFVNGVLARLKRRVDAGELTTVPKQD